MSTPVVVVCVGVAVVMALSMLVAGWRIAVGPTDVDRGVAADLVFFAFVALVAVLGLWWSPGLLYDVVLIASIVGFLASVATARLLTRGRR